MPKSLYLKYHDSFPLFGSSEGYTCVKLNTHLVDCLDPSDDGGMIVSFELLPSNVTGDDGGWPVEGIRVRVLQLPRGGHEGGDGDERSHHCGQAPVRGPGPTYFVGDLKFVDCPTHEIHEFNV